MLRFARYHAAFSIGGDTWPELSEHLRRLRQLVDAPAILIMRLLDCLDRSETFETESVQESIEILESYIFRRAICGEQTRGYWQVFANLAYGINEDDPLLSLKVGLARQHENYGFPNDSQFRSCLCERDLYALRICWYMLVRFENHNNKEPAVVTNYSIEHILPQNENLSSKWREMLGEDWQEIQKAWLHRLGNLTLTGYNPEYSDRDFETKKTIDGGFNVSSLRLNQFVRDQTSWTHREIKARGEELAARSLDIWPAIHVDPAAIESAKQAELRSLAAKRDVAKVQMTAAAQVLFESLAPRVKKLDVDIVELAEHKSVSYHAPRFFLEVLPRKHNLVLLLELDFNEVVDPAEIAADATEWSFFFYASHEAGVTVNIKEEQDIDNAMPIIQQALKLANA